MPDVNSQPVPRLLVVDDNEGNRYAVSRTLARAGFEVLEARTGSEALEQVRRNLDLVILDIHLPDIDGFEVARRLRADPATAALPIVHLSASFVDSSSRAFGLEQGADAYLVHPAAPEVLIATVRTLLRARRAEQQARALAAQWARTFDTITDPVAIVDGAGVVRRANAAFRRTLGEPGAGPLPERFAQRAVLERLLAQGGTDALVEDGRHYRATVSRGGEGEESVVTLHDYTDRARAEARLRRIVDSGMLGVAIWREQRLVEANRAWAAMFGVSEDAAQARELHWETLTAPAWHEAGRRMIDQLSGRGHTEPFELEMVRADGSHFTALVVAAVVDGDVREVITCVVDMTERKAAAHFEQQLIGIVGHDLRNPLAAVHASAEVLARGASLDEKARRSVDRIRSSSRRMTRIIADLLDFTLVRAQGGLPVTLAPVSLETVCRDVVDEAAVSTRDRTIEVTVDGDSAGLFDAARLEQLVGNLLANALRYSPAATPVRVRVAGRADEVSVRIENQGEPIPEELMRDLFQPFRRGGTLGETKMRSIGLGLFISKRIVDAHHGEIRVSSEATEGTAFEVVLPRRPPTGARAANA